MKPFNNVIVSAAEPKNNADVWIKHSKNLLRLNDYTESKSGLTLTVKNNVIKITGSGSDTFYLDKIINFTDLANKIKGKTITLSSTDINYCSFTLATGQSPYFLQLGTLIDELRKKQTKEITEDLAYGSIYVPEKVNEQTIEFKLQIEFGDTATDWQEPFEDDILVNDNGVYNSVLNRKNAISLGIKEQVNITQQGLRILVPMDNLSVKVGETFELLSDGTIKILKNTIIFAFAQTQLIINDTDTGRLYIEKNGDGICAEEGKGTKAYQAMGIFNVNVGDIIRVTVVNVTAGRGNTGTTVSFNHLDMYEI